MALEQRRLAAIIAADVVGYSRLMGRDESGTLARLREHRQQRFEPALARYGGRLVKLTGDGALAEFPSAVGAMSAAIAFQQAMADANQGQPEEAAIVFRTGLHLGDLIVEGDDLYGDGVNVAARLEVEAPPGGILISRTVHEAVVGRLRATFDDLGDLALKHIDRPVRAFRVKWDAADWPAAASALQTSPAPAVSTVVDAPLPLPDKPSIAVLPFHNMSGDPEQEYFADGITEDIITALSRTASLFVIARNSTFTYKGRSVDVRQVGRELGVRYVLEGSVRKAGQRLRITGQLVEAESRAHLWADRFDSALEDVFDLQDRVTMAVAGAIEPSVTQAEIKRANRKPTENLQAYDWLLKALGEQQLYSRDGVDSAMRMARRAAALDPRYAQAHSYLASWIQLRKIYGWMDDEAAETADGVRLAHLAVQLEPSDSIVLTEAAFALGHLSRDLATALPWFDRAIAVNPNSAKAFGRGAIVRNFAGDYVTAADHADRAMRLSPFDSHFFTFSLARGFSHLYRRQVPEAVAWLGKAAQENPRHAPTFMHLASALAHAGLMEEAGTAIRRLLELRPQSSMTWSRRHRLYPEDDYEYVLEGARRAGLPD
ncbi:MAG TPA: adenylate/guanylate cyclase domain-containing protein [Vineibacter sp.]|nr:adenylate/guanylate cyclase domain-containing protein [Vineibacter sp.]